MELYAESYDAMNRSLYCKNLGLREILRGGRSQPYWIQIGIGLGPSARLLAGEEGQRGEELGGGDAGRRRGHRSGGGGGGVR